MKSEIKSLIEEAWAIRNTNPKKGAQQLALAENLLRSAIRDPQLAKNFTKIFAQWQWVQGAYLAQSGNPDEARTLLNKAILTFE